MVSTHHPSAPAADPASIPDADPEREGPSVRRVLQRLRWTLYGLAAIVYLFPQMDMLSSVLPLRPLDVRWRFQFTTLFGQSMLTQAMALVGAGLVARITRHKSMASLIRFVAFVEAALILPLSARFVLDFRQIRPAIKEELRGRLQIVTYKTCLELLLAALLIAFLWWQLELREKSSAIQVKTRKRRRRVRVTSDEQVLGG